MTNELYHHGVLGMKWGVRRYQNADGSLTSAGKKRYGTKSNFEKVQAKKTEWKNTRKDYIGTKSRGRNVANVILNGPAGAYTYNSLRATGKSRLVSAGATGASGLIAGPLGQVAVSTYVSANYRNNNKYNMMIKKELKSASKDVKRAFN